MTSAHKALTLVIVFVAFMGSAHAVLADYSIDTASATSGSIGYIGYSSATSQQGAQSFTTIGAGTLDVQNMCIFIAQGSPTGGVTVELFADSGGTPTGSVLASGTIAAGDISGTQQLVAVSGLAGVTLAASTSYWLVSRRTDNTNSTSNNYGGCGTLTDTYAGGEWIVNGVYPAWSAGAGRDQRSTLQITEATPPDTTATTTPDAMPQTLFFGFVILMVGLILPIQIGRFIDTNGTL